MKFPDPEAIQLSVELHDHLHILITRQGCWEKLTSRCEEKRLSPGAFRPAILASILRGFRAAKRNKAECSEQIEDILPGQHL